MIGALHTVRPRVGALYPAELYRRSFSFDVFGHSETPGDNGRHAPPPAHWPALRLGDSLTSSDRQYQILHGASRPHLAVPLTAPPVLMFVKSKRFDSVCAPEATTAQRDPRFRWSASQARTKTTQALRSATSALTVTTASSPPTMLLYVPRVHSARRVPSSASSFHAPTAHTRTRQDWLLRRSVLSVRLEGAYSRSITLFVMLLCGRSLELLHL